MEIQTADRITGKRLFDVFDQLQKDRTILKVNLPGKGFEGLTIVTGVDILNRDHCFLIDYPGGSRDVVQSAVGGRALFEYSAEDKLQYNFRSVVSKAAKDDIWVIFPEAIERLQRRKHFRIAPPLGTKVLFQEDNKRFEFNVLNICEGGALINQKAQFHDNKMFYIGGYLSRFYVICDEDYAKARICIKKAEIRRMEKDPDTGKFQYALQFLDVGRTEEKELKEYIYRCQREVLIKRLGFD